MVSTEGRTHVGKHLPTGIFTSNMLSSLGLIAGLAGLALITVNPSAAVVPLTQSECNALGASKVNIVGNYTFICGYPFNATIPFGTNLVWIDTEQWHGKYHHTISSVNGIFKWQDQTVVNVLITSPFQVNHSYRYYDELNSNQTGYITVAPHNGTSSVTILNPSEVRTSTPVYMIVPINSTDSGNSTNNTGTQSPRNNNSTPLMLPPISVGLPSKTPWVNPNNGTSNTTSIGITSSYAKPNTQCATPADISTLAKEIKKLEAQNIVLQTQVANQKNMTDTIFGMITKLLHNFNLT